MQGSADHPEPPVFQDAGALGEPPSAPHSHGPAGSAAPRTVSEPATVTEPAIDSTIVVEPATEPKAPSLVEAELTPESPIATESMARTEPVPGLESSVESVPPVPLIQSVGQHAQLAEPLAIHHIGVAVSSIDEALRFYGDKLGLSVADRRTMPERSLKVAFVRTGNTLIELLEPTDPESPVARFIERRGPGLHHLCFGTPDIAEHLRDLKDKGVDLIDAVARPGAHGSVAFIQPSAAYGVLVELLQERLPDAEAPY